MLQVLSHHDSVMPVLLLQEQAVGLEKYMQQLGQLPAFQKGLEQALGKNHKQELQNGLCQKTTLPQKPRVPIPGYSLVLIVSHDSCLTPCHMLHVACHMLHVACCMLHIACCMLHVACSMLPACGILPLQQAISKMLHMYVVTMGCKTMLQ